MQNLIYYDKDMKGGKITLNNLQASIEGILSGKVSYKYSENILERMARVRFSPLFHSFTNLFIFSCSILTAV